MGRTILCPHCNSALNEDILKQRNSENICLVCGKSLLGDKTDGDMSTDEHPDWITWWYYKDEETQCFTLRDEPIDLEKWTDTKLIKEFKAPPRDSSGSSEKAKEILRTYVSDAFKEPQETHKVKCPYCFSSEVQIVPRKFSLLTGFATNKFDRVCLRCKKKF